MIRPGLVTASMSRADHFGIDGDWLACFCILSRAPFRVTFRAKFALAVAPKNQQGAVRRSTQKRSAALCGGAVAYDGSDGGGLDNFVATARISGMRRVGRSNSLKNQFIVYDSLQWNVCRAGIRK